MSSLDEQCRAALNGPGDRQAIEYRGQWHPWREVKRIADGTEQLLKAAGLKPGMPVAFVPRNCPSAIACELGMIAARFTIKMVYAFQSPAGIARDVGRIEAAAVIAATEDFTSELLAVVKEKGLTAIAFGPGAMSVEAASGASQSLAATQMPESSEPRIEVHTSGTTGPPKHVGFTYDTISRYIVGQNISSVSGDAAPPALLFFPLGNISGIYSTLPPLLSGRRAVLLDRFSLDRWLDFVKRYRPAAPSLPPAGIALALDADLPREVFAGVKMIMTGAAPLDPSIQRAFEEKYRVPILLSYGATEFGGPVTLMTPDDYAQFGPSKRGSVGRAYGGAQLRIVDEQTGEELKLGDEGLLEVIAPRIGNDWIRTTDIAMLDSDGFLWHRGRADGAIIRGGFKLLPEAIERAICAHSSVVGAIVVGLKDVRLGQVPAAAIQLKTGTSPPSIEELEHHVRQHVYATHIPIDWVFVERLPLNASSKPDLVAVKALFKDRGGEPAASSKA